MVDFNKMSIESTAKRKIASFSEDQLQAFIYKRFWNTVPLYRRRLFSVPNGGNRDGREANKLKSTGLVAGIPDLLFFSKDLLIFFELKKEKGKLSDSQIILKKIINGQGNPYFIVRTPDQFFYAFILTLMNRNKLNKQDSLKLMRAVQDEEGLIFFGLTEVQFEYEMKVFSYIFEMKKDTPESIIELTEPETRPRFITAIKKFIHLEYDYSNNFQLVFSEDYTSFIKQTI